MLLFLSFTVTRVHFGRLPKWLLTFHLEAAQRLGTRMAPRPSFRREDKRSTIPQLCTLPVWERVSPSCQRKLTKKLEEIQKVNQAKTREMTDSSEFFPNGFFILNKFWNSRKLRIWERKLPPILSLIQHNYVFHIIFQYSFICMFYKLSIHVTFKSFFIHLYVHLLVSF